MIARTFRAPALDKLGLGLAVMLAITMAAASAQACRIHCYREGETFCSIARACKVSVQALQRANPNLQARRLCGGMKIIVPCGQVADPVLHPPLKHSDWNRAVPVAQRPPSAKPTSAVLHAPKPKPAAPKPQRPTVASARANSWVKDALSYRGVRYAHGGLSSRGLDCSGLIARVLLDHGLRVPHSSAQLYQMGKPVRKQDLRPGDLVFFNSQERPIDHVAMYIGSGKIVHAAHHRGAVVTDRLDQKYYLKHYIGARRLF